MKIKLPFFETDSGEIGKTFNKIKGVFVKAKKFDKYFSVIGAYEVNYVVYQLGLRPNIPLVDLLYLEFLHYLLKNKRVSEIILFPSVDLSYPTQTKDDFEAFKKNVFTIVRNYKNNMCFIDPFVSGVSVEQLLSREFLQVIKHIGSIKFIKFIKNVLDWKGDSFGDFNKFHPDDIRLLTIYIHLIKGWIIRAYLIKNGIIDNRRLNLGIFMWETEVYKIGIFQWMAEHNSNLSITPILGKTIFYEKNKPLPVFDPKITICIFENFRDIILKLVNKKDKEIKKYVELLVTILMENYSENITYKVAYKHGRNLFKQQELSFPKLVNIKKLTKKGYIALYLIHLLKMKYSNGQRKPAEN